MLASIYIIIAVIFFFAQRKNGLFTALLTATFWPIVLASLTLFGFFSVLYHSVKK